MIWEKENRVISYTQIAKPGKRKKITPQINRENCSAYQRVNRRDKEGKGGKREN